MIVKPKQPKLIGELTEALWLTKFLTKGWIVSKPHGDNAPYDLIVDNGERLITVQSRTGILRKNHVKFNVRSVRINSSREYYYKYPERVDYFAVYCYELDEYYWIPNVGLPKAECNIALDHMGKFDNKGKFPSSRYLF